MSGVAINPNWPVIDYAWCPAAGPSQTILQPYWSSLRERTKGKAHVVRGKQYELDQYQPGEAQFTIRNHDSAFDPTNVSSPYYGYVIPYRLFRIRAQWPPTPNVLTQNQATAGETTAPATISQLEQAWAPGATPPDWYVWKNAAAPTTTVASASAWQGGQVFNHAIQPSLGYPSNIVGMQGWSVVPSMNYAFTIQARSATGGITSTGRAVIQWFNASGASLGTTNGSTVGLSTGTTWTTLTATDTAPAGATGAVIYLQLLTGPATTGWTLQSDGWDARRDTTPGYSTPGIWYPLFTGYIERWPQQFGDAGNDATMDLEAYDLFSFFANRSALAPFLADLLALNPNFLYTLDESSGTSTFADLSNKRGPAIVSAAALSLVATSGQSVASGDNNPQGPDQGTALTGAFMGAPGPVLHSVSPTAAAASQLNGRGAILIPPDKTTGLTGPPQSGGFTRLIAARLTGLTSSGNQAAWQYLTLNGGFIDTEFDISIDYSGDALMSGSCVGRGASLGTLMPGLGYFGSVASLTPTDTDWHLYGVSLSADSLTLRLWCDGSPVAAVQVGTGSARPVGGGIDSIGGMSTSASFYFEWNGDLAFATELPFEMTGAVWTALARSWRNAWSTVPGVIETSDQRYQRVLNWLSNTGPTRISPGICKSVGPAIDVAGQAGLQALQAVVDTENGQHFIGSDGVPVFQSRADRYNKLPIVTFGENASGGEVPYMAPQMDFDPTRIANDIQITATSGNSLYRATDGPATDPTKSQGKYGTIELQRNVNSVDPNELTAAAQWLLYENKDAHLRVEEITVRASAMVSAWPALLGLDLGQCTALKRRPTGGSAIGMTGFLEKITWDLDGDTGVAECAVQISNNETKKVAQFDSARFAPDAGSLTLSAGLSSSATSVVLATAAGSPTLTMTAASYPFDIVVDGEQITLTAVPNQSVSPQTYTGCVRGVGSLGPAATHSAGAQVVLAAQAPWGY